MMKYFNTMYNKDIFFSTFNTKINQYKDSLQINLAEFDNLIPSIEEAKAATDSYLGAGYWNSDIDIKESDITIENINDDKLFEEIDNLLEEVLNSNFTELKRNIDNLKEFLLNIQTNIYLKSNLHRYLDPRGDQTEAVQHPHYFVIDPVVDWIDDIINYFSVEEVQLLIKPFCLIYGEALIGKTHLLCHTGDSFLQNEKPCILILGHTIADNNNLKKMILDKLDLGHLPFDTFLKEMQLMAERKNIRSIIMIDGINEAGLNSNWLSQLAGLMKDISAYPNIGLVLSVRDITKSRVISSTAEKELTQIRHDGFDGIEQDVLIKMCSLFKIQMPSVPILNKINYNPGLLLIFFEMLKKEGKDYIDVDIISPIFIFENLLKNANLRLSMKYNIEPELDELTESIILIIEYLIEKEENQIKYKEVSKILTDNSLKIEVKDIVSEGFISTYYDQSKKESYLFFTYEKFENYFMAKYIVKKHIFFTSNQLTKESQSFLEEILSDANNFFNNDLILEPLFVLLSNNYKIEIINLDVDKDNDKIINIFLSTLSWRTKDSFTKISIDYIEKLIFNGYSEKVLVSLVQLSIFPNHPLNAFELHKILLGLKMPNRDALWSSLLCSKEHLKIFERIISWAWKESYDIEISNESKLLYGLILGWMLSTSNRKIRDTATKALVSLFTNQLDIYLELMQKFEEVDDLYILERLYAVAYGIVSRSEINYESKSLADYIFNVQFINNKPYPHVLLRDYAKGLIEIVNKEIELEYDLKLIKPPYETSFECDDISLNDIDIHKEKKGLNYVWYSLMYNNGGSISDFGNYVLNSTLNEWSGKEIDNVYINKEEVLTKFIESLDKTNIEIWEELTGKNFKFDFKNFNKQDYEYLFEENDIEEETDPFSVFLEKLNSKERNYFLSEIKPYLKSNFNIEEPLRLFDHSFAQRWIFKRIVEMGYDSSLLGKIDEEFKSSQRYDHNIERIGKKYQWIAYHELIARISDNYKLNDDYREGKNKKYEGPWITSLRDIDPTILLQNKKQETLNPKYEYNFILNKDSHKDWLSRKDDILDLKELVFWNHDDILLDGFLSFKEKELKHNQPIKQICYSIKTYVVKSNEIDCLYEKENNKISSSLHNRRDSLLHDVFLKEYPYSNSFKEFHTSYYGRDGWTDKNESLICKIATTSDKYLNEYEYDMSKSDNISLQLPSFELSEILNLKHNKNQDGAFDYKEDTSFIKDVLCKNQRHSSLIANKKILGLLEEKGYSILWTLHIEKNLIHKPKDLKVKWLNVHTLGYFKNKDFIENKTFKYE